jgi:hypothetical protein
MSVSSSLTTTHDTEHRNRLSHDLSSSSSSPEAFITITVSLSLLSYRYKASFRIRFDSAT